MKATTGINYLDQLNAPSPSQVRFEDERVKMVVNRFRLHKRLYDLLGDSQARHGMRRLTFESFDHLFPTFPIKLEARYRGRVGETCSPVDMFRKFDAVFLHQYYLEFFGRHSASSDDRPAGLLVPFDGLRGGLIVHNGEFATRTTKMVHAIANDVPPHFVTVEPFGGLLKYMAAGGWSPNAPTPALAAKQESQVSRALTIEPGMIERLGTSPALVVLAWLLKIFNSPSGYHRHFVRRLSDNEHCVAATQEQIASETGLSERQVKRGMEHLRREGLIETGTGRQRSEILLRVIFWELSTQNR